jgi:hypothetical protein
MIAAFTVRKNQGARICGKRQKLEFSIETARLVINRMDGLRSNFYTSATDHGRSGNQRPSEDYFADGDGPAPERLPCPGPPFDHRRMAIKFDKPVAIEQPQKTGVSDPGEGPFPVTTEQVERSPTEGSSRFGPTAIQEPAAIVDEGPPAPLRTITRRAVGMEPGIALRPGAWDAAVVLDDGSAFFEIGRVRLWAPFGPLGSLGKLGRIHRPPGVSPILPILPKVRVCLATERMRPSAQITPAGIEGG